MSASAPRHLRRARALCQCAKAFLARSANCGRTSSAFLHENPLYRGGEPNNFDGIQHHAAIGHMSEFGPYLGIYLHQACIFQPISLRTGSYRLDDRNEGDELGYICEIPYEHCPPGTHILTPSRTHCAPCPPGSFQPGLSFRGLQDCQPCPVRRVATAGIRSGA